MRKRSGQVHSRESSATLQLTVSLLYLVTFFRLANKESLWYGGIRSNFSSFKNSYKPVSGQNFPLLPQFQKLIIIALIVDV